MTEKDESQAVKPSKFPTRRLAHLLIGALLAECSAEPGDQYFSSVLPPHFRSVEIR